MEIRTLHENELEALSWLHRYAFGGWTDETKDDWISWMRPNETVGAFDNGVLVSGVTVIPLLQSIRGTIENMGGVAAVATYPEKRRRGHIRELFRATFKMMNDREMPVSMLSAFRRTFYAKFGYVPANTGVFAKTHMQSLRSALDIRVDEELQIERCRMVESRETYSNFIKEVCMPRYHGMTLAPHMSDHEWRDRSKDAMLVLIKRENKIEALAKYRIKVEHLELPGYERQSLIVYEMYWRDLRARDALFHFLALHIDQMEEISLYIPLGEPFQNWFPDADWKMSTWQAWSVRVINVERALRGLPVNSPGSVTISIRDEYCPWNNRTIQLVENKGRLHVEPTDKTPTGTLTIEGVSALVYGTLHLDEIVHRGWCRLQRTQDRETLSGWFPPIPIHCALDF